MYSFALLTESQNFMIVIQWNYKTLNDFVSIWKSLEAAKILF